MVRNLAISIVALIAALGLLAACTPEGVVDVTPTEEPSPTTAPRTRSPTPEQSPTSPRDPSPSLPPEAEPEAPQDATMAVAWAKKDLAARLGVSPEGIALVSIDAVEWRDSSLGCPQPGQMYLQVITPGYRFVLRADDATYEYHSARGADQAILCEGAS